MRLRGLEFTVKLPHGSIPFHPYHFLGDDKLITLLQDRRRVNQAKDQCQDIYQSRMF